jgi:hypothetical protein
MGVFKMNRLNDAKVIRDDLHLKRVALILDKQCKQAELNRINEMLKIVDELIIDADSK